MPDQTAQRPGITGAVVTMNTAANDDSFNNDGMTLLIIENGGVAPTVLTLDDPNTPVPVGSSAVNDAAITITNGTTRVCGPFKRSRFNDANGKVQMDWSVLTSVTWAAVSAA